MTKITQEQKDQLHKACVDLVNAISSYSGNKLTNWQPFQTLMVEEKINVLADAVTLLLILHAEELRPPQESIINNAIEKLKK